MHNEELHNLNCSPVVISVIKLWIMKWVRLEARMKEVRNAYIILFGKLEGRHHLEDLGTDDRIIFTRVLRKQDVRVWTGFMWILRKRL